MINNPPYRGTAEYKEKFDYARLDEWFENNPYTCFMSAYNTPHKCIFEIAKQKLANNKNVIKREYAIEKLFWNGK